MNQDEILQRNRQQPFEPYRLVLTTGDSYEIRHPDLALVTRSAVHIGIPAAKSKSDAAREVVIVSLIHVVKIEFLNSAAANESN
jgi:hypothetical protein